ncbi:MAG: hypothetical protein B655_0689 [Methanobacterium sp. Maddingley MBC34]|nr:MAG: hypothetical protein B655_0689 [Methanobacterium sp. Maddingley MBC34]
MGSKNRYSRKISSKEANNNFIFILKNNLYFFPPLGEVFVLKRDNFSCEVQVESYPCTCRGPNLPHEHYFIKWEGLETGDKLEIKRTAYKNNEYHLKIVK